MPPRRAIRTATECRPPRVRRPPAPRARRPPALPFPLSSVVHTTRRSSSPRSTPAPAVIPCPHPPSSSPPWLPFKSMQVKVNGGRVREKKPTLEVDLNAMYADLPVPHYDWEEMPTGPVPRLAGYSAHIRDLLYVFAG
ncbi:hypothetical protein ABZP36_022976 [Zizania latifolia]